MAKEKLVQKQLHLVTKISHSGTQTLYVKQIFVIIQA